MLPQRLAGRRDLAPGWFLGPCKSGSWKVHVWADGSRGSICGAAGTEPSERSGGVITCPRCLGKVGRRLVPFLSLVDVRQPDACWRWLGRRRDCKGYGGVTIDGRPFQAHRIAFQLFIGPIPDGLEILHSCDNRPCVNPNHLKAGTHSANMAEMVSRGRAATGDRSSARLHPERWRRGSTHVRAKLTEEVVLQIRASHETSREIAARLGLSTSAVSHARTRRSWRHI